MQTGMITSTSNDTSSTGTATSKTLGKDAFLKLLVSELQNQDPTQAQDPNAMISQMAQFSALEQSTNTNALLTSMQTQVSALFQGQSAALIGTNVQVTSDSLNLASGKASIGISLPNAASKVSIAILNAAGQTVSTLTPGAMGAGNQVVDWDGKDSNGNQLPDGSYSVSITATDAAGKTVDASPTANATVTAVSFSNGVITVTAGGKQYPLSSINKISA